MELLCFRCRAIGYRQHRLGVQLSQPQASLSRLWVPISTLSVLSQCLHAVLWELRASD